MIPAAFTAITHNPFLQGAGIMGMGATLFTYIRNLPKKAFDKLKSHRLRKLFVGKYPYPDLLTSIRVFIDEESKTKVKSVEGTMTTQHSNRQSSYYEEELYPSTNGDSSEYNINFKPCDEEYKLTYKNKTMYAKMMRPEKKDEKSNDPSEIVGIELSSYFLTLDDMKEFVESHVAKLNESLDDRPKIYRFGDRWTSKKRTEKRFLDSLIFNDSKLPTFLRQDIKRFLDESQWYQEMNIPHRRGYLFYGKPGNGKSSLLRALATEFGFGLAPINLSQTSENQLISMFDDIPPKTFIVLEDVDAMFDTKLTMRVPDDLENHNPPTLKRVASGDDDSTTGETPKDMNNPFMNLRGPTLSGILNILDGVETSKNRIIFMTTNHIEKLDMALIRPGRVDIKIKIDNPNQLSIAKIYDRFFPNASAHDRREFVHQFVPGSACMAEIQEKLIQMREQEVRRANTLYEKFDSSIIVSESEIYAA